MRFFAGFIFGFYSGPKLDQNRVFVKTEDWLICGSKVVQKLFILLAHFWHKVGHKNVHK